jgi:hypothetical protein
LISSVVKNWCKDKRESFGFAKNIFEPQRHKDSKEHEEKRK